MAVKTWELAEWVDSPDNSKLPPMTEEGKIAGIKFLRDDDYPKPEDCPATLCKEYRPACKLGICKIAIVMPGDW